MVNDRKQQKNGFFDGKIYAELIIDGNGSRINFSWMAKLTRFSCYLFLCFTSLGMHSFFQ
jgi:hypothetical protein